MTVRAYALATSLAQGESLRFVLDRPSPVVVSDATDDRVVHTGHAGTDWSLEIPRSWPSSLYVARFGPARPWPRSLPGGAPCPDNEVHFVVRQAEPTAAILVSVPFTTWQAYNRAGEPDQSVYWTESPTRAAKVSFDRPGGGPPPERWEEGLMRWLRRSGYEVGYCSNLDLHDGLDLLSRHRLLVVNGHDEYWSAGMRDAVEEFVRRGGNVAFFSGNTAWWQMRLEDGGRTMVCHRDPVSDPAADPLLATVEWSAAYRPENTLTGVSFRAGAGAWGEHMPRMLEESYTARFAGHWAFEGTGLTDGDKFGQGCLGYETDAAEFEEIGGVPRVTCRDGTPSSFVVLATADLRHWSTYGQGGAATMGVFTSGLGTVFTVGTVNWGNTLHDPVVARVTRNVLDRLSRPLSPSWEVIGPPADVQALAVVGRRLHAVDGEGVLLARELCGQNLAWQPLPGASAVVGLAVPREAAGGVGVALYGVTASGELLYREGEAWRPVGPAPREAVGLAIADCAFYVATASGSLWRLPFGAATWEDDGSSAGAVSLAGMNGRLYSLDAAGVLRTRIPGSGWEEHATAVPGRALTAHAGLLVTGGPDDPLRWHPARKPAVR
ncbi:N,N-dimethylformamidase beta subunit family domain-containing protein [Nonomuraea sp. bgisy101]|uniref:N,N-dimethylformamidase beta subunit family domain-containing protein n=1 Tax=Nonomuraea sp. bgisy101 TaxID=3413784 RepID=UPI003D704659